MDTTRNRPSPPESRERALDQRRKQYRAEASRANLYRRLSAIERGERAAALLRALGRLEAAQAEFWAQGLPEQERRDADYLTPRDRAVYWLARRFGPRGVAPILASDALANVKAYATQPEAAPVLEVEREIARQAAGLAGVRPATGPALDVGRDHRRHIAANGSLRAAVFGINDGLVSNLSLVMGVVGANPPREVILLTGLAGLLAGAFSMAGGEFISMLSQREVLERQIEVERRHIAEAPEAERAMLAQRYEDKGLPAPHAQHFAEHLMSDAERALDTIAREQLGLDPGDLGSPRAAAIASFVTFALGALIPILPFLLTSGPIALVLSAVLSGIALFLVGGALSFFTGRNVLLSGARMLLIGSAAAVVTFLIGRVIGVTVAG